MRDLNRFILGTVQLGIPYGINNHVGQPSLSVAQNILRSADQLKVRAFDTADGYGTSSEAIGSVSELKTPVLSKFAVNENFVSFEAALATSLKRLCRSQIEAYSFHRFSDFQKFSFWDQVQAAKEKQHIRKLGISIYSVEEGLAAAKASQIDVIQMPFNVLDNWRRRGDITKMAKDNGKEVHVRSVYLQGLFFKDPNLLTGNTIAFKNILNQIREIGETANLSIPQICLGYALSKTEIDGIVMGVETVEQLNENAKLFATTNLDQEVVRQLERLEFASSELLNPANWRESRSAT